MEVFRFWFLAVLLVSFLRLNAQTTKTKIYFPQRTLNDSIQISFQDGLNLIDIATQNNKDDIIISKPFYGRFAEINIIFNSEEESESVFNFYVDERPSAIFFFYENNKIVLDTLQSINYIVPDNLEKTSLEKSTASIYEEIEDFFRKEGDKLDDPTVSSRGTQLMDSLYNTIFDFINVNTSSYFAFKSIKGLAPTEKYSGLRLINLFNKFPDSFTKTVEGDVILETLTGFSLQPGMKAPGFSLIDLNGNQIELQSLKGKYVLLNFWASWCIPCLAEMPTIVNIGKTISRDKLELVFLSSDRDMQAMDRAIRKYEIEGIHIVSNDEIVRKYGAQALPQLFLIDLDGRIIYSRNVNEEELEKLETLMSMIEKI